MPEMLFWIFSAIFSHDSWFFTCIGIGGMLLLAANAPRDEEKS